MDDLAEHLVVAPASPLVFPAPTGGHIRRSNFRRRVWLPAVDAVGLSGLRIHDLRHTAVSWMIAAGEHPATISQRLGHASVQTILDRYGHILPGLDAEAAERLDALWAGAQTTDPAAPAWPKASGDE